MAHPVITLTNLIQQMEECLTVLVVFVNIFTAVSTRGHVVKRSGKLQS
jgi:hypothetical protein